jgi:hypothetical protein
MRKKSKKRMMMSRVGKIPSSLMKIRLIQDSS